MKTSAKDEQRFKDCEYALVETGRKDGPNQYHVIFNYKAGNRIYVHSFQTFEADFDINTTLADLIPQEATDIKFMNKWNEG